MTSLTPTSSALTVLNAAASDKGAMASIALTSTGTSSTDTDSLRQRLVDLYQTAETQAAEESGFERSRKRRARARAAQQARMQDMGRALGRLRGDNPAQGGTLVGVQGGDVLALRTGNGDDSVAISSNSVSNISTGGGNDALTIEADTISSVYTSRSARHARGEAGGSDNDALALKADTIDSIYTGAGTDALALQAQIVTSVYAGSGNDSIAVSAGALTGIYAGDGNDAVTIDAVMGASRGYAWASGETPYAAPTTLSESLSSVMTDASDVDLGAGDDTLSIRAEEGISVRAGTGDDLIAVGGGTVALQYDAGDGNDVVAVTAGATLAIQLEHGQEWTSEWDGDALVIGIGDGSIRIEGAAGAAGIGILQYGVEDPVILHESGISMDVSA